MQGAKQDRWADAIGRLLVVSMLYMGLHWAVLPHAERFFVAAYLCMAVAITRWGLELRGAQSVAQHGSDALWRQPSQYSKSLAAARSQLAELPVMKVASCAPLPQQLEDKEG